MLVNFGWVRPGMVAGMGFPDETAWPRLVEIGIGAVLSLTERAPPGDPAAHGLAHRHVPIQDFGVPSPAALVGAVDWMEAQITADRAVVVHCGAGIGRTGMLLAAWLVRSGLDPDRAIDEVRRLRPGSIETPEQAALVRAFAAAEETSGR